MKLSPIGIVHSNYSRKTKHDYLDRVAIEAKIEIYHLNDENALAEIRNVAALAVRCLELHGCPERIIPEDLK